jgi:hypothetical protein
MVCIRDHRPCFSGIEIVGHKMVVKKTGEKDIGNELACFFNEVI